MINAANSLSQKEADVDRSDFVVATLAMVTVEHCVSYYHLQKKKVLCSRNDLFVIHTSVMGDWERSSHALSQNMPCVAMT